MGTGRHVYTSLELCAGGGGQALGLEHAGFEPLALIENDANACATLRHNRPQWNVLEADLRDFKASDHPEVTHVDLVAGGVPCTPYSIAGLQHGVNDERDLLDVAISIVADIRPRAVMIENVTALLTAKFDDRRAAAGRDLSDLGYQFEWMTVNAMHFGLAQDRKRCVLVALQADAFFHFRAPGPVGGPPPTVGEVLEHSMASRGWQGAPAWAKIANGIAPTIVGGSKKHGGADLGPERAKARWAELGVNGNAIAEGDLEPEPDFELEFDVGRKGRYGLPKLTVAQVATLQGFPESWAFQGSKTTRYKQVGNAFPPPVAAAVARQIALALEAEDALHGEGETSIPGLPAA